MIVSTLRHHSALHDGKGKSGLRAASPLPDGVRHLLLPRPIKRTSLPRTAMPERQQRGSPRHCPASASRGDPVPLGGFRPRAVRPTAVLRRTRRATKKKVRQKARSQEVVFSRGPPRIVRHTDPGGIRACRTSSRWALCARGPHMKARSTDHSAAARSEGHCASGRPRKGTIVSHFPIRGCDCGHSPTNRRGAIFEWDSLATWSLPRGAAASERKALSCTLPQLEWCC